MNSFLKQTITDADNADLMLLENTPAQTKSVLYTTRIHI